MKKNKTYTQHEIVEMFNPPMFNWLFDWYALKITPREIYDSIESQRANLPFKRITEVIWRSEVTGRIKKKIYNYQF